MERIGALGIVLSIALSGCLGGSRIEPVSETPSILPPPLRPLEFLPLSVVDSERIASEPSIKVARDGTIFVAAPTGTVKYATRPLDLVAMADKGAFQGAIWKSTDGGRTFTFLSDFPAGLPYKTIYPGGGDSDIAIDRDGVVYVVDQLGLATETISVSRDGGRTWEEASPLSAGIPGNDRPWIWPTRRAGELYMVVDGPPGTGIVVSHTTDSGRTWEGRVVTDFNTAPGPITVLPDGTIAFATDRDGKPTLYISHDGTTFTPWVPPGFQGELVSFWVQVFSDFQGTLYSAWLQKAENTTDVVLTFSTDSGRTWSSPRILFREPGSAIFPWGVGGSDGRIALTYYAAEDPSKEWYATALVVLNSTRPEPVIYHGRVSSIPARIGPPCEGGVGCLSGRELGDFQQCAVAPDGTLYVAWVVVKSAEEGGRVVVSRASEEAPKLVVQPPPDPWVV